MCIRDSLYGVEGEYVNFKTGFLYFAITVSYTHLDVYKRQVSDNVNTRSSFLWIYLFFASVLFFPFYDVMYQISDWRSNLVIVAFIVSDLLVVVFKGDWLRLDIYFLLSSYAVPMKRCPLDTEIMDRMLSCLLYTSRCV